MRYLTGFTRPSQQGWALLLLAVIMAAALRFWQLGDLPPGLYRDEALNGLDAVSVLTGQQEGESLFFFEANNGREPIYIYLVAASISALGRSALAVRLGAAVIGTLTTWFTYKLAEAWFGRQVGILSAWTWAITLWPIHLSRIGLRPILLPLIMALTLWLATLAFRRQQRSGNVGRILWFLTGLSYGIGFYTYLAVRFTIILVILLVVYLILTGKKGNIWPGLGWSAQGFLVALIPLGSLAWRQPDLILGRIGQVSIFDPVINQGDLPGTFLTQLWRTASMFAWQGDTIIRHNPPGRPVFDWVMLPFFLLGLACCIRNWRRVPAMTLLLWSAVMLGPTILAEDAPHFLRSVGILPAIVIFPAIGLWQLWHWSKLPARTGSLLVMVLLAATAALTIKDYFFEYGRLPETAYWFEAGARDLAEFVNAEPEGVSVLIDQRFEDSWPSILFLIENENRISLFRPDELLPNEINPRTSIYAWPHEDLNMVAASVEPPALVQGQTGSLVQGDLDPAPYPLFVRYTVDEETDLPIMAHFDNYIQLHRGTVTSLDEDTLRVDLYWSTTAPEARQLKSFVHVQSPTGLAGQSDTIPSQGNWPSIWWQPGLVVHDRHIVELDEKIGIMQPQIRVGLYNAYTEENLSVTDIDGEYIGDSWLLRP